MEVTNFKKRNVLLYLEELADEFAGEVHPENKQREYFLHRIAGLITDIDGSEFMKWALEKNEGYEE